MKSDAPEPTSDPTLEPTSEPSSEPDPDASPNAESAESGRSALEDLIATASPVLRPLLERQLAAGPDGCFADGATFNAFIEADL
uniref:Uncharacterized protein n=1 Tax=Streptomyces sp. NBC_00049 TaxID=2903617 RepID=A0AAU2JYX2_9ACTN